MKINRRELKRVFVGVVAINAAAVLALWLLGEAERSGEEWRCTSTGIELIDVGAVELVDLPDQWLVECRVAHEHGDAPVVQTRSGHRIHVDDAGEVSFEKSPIVDWIFNAQLTVEGTKTRQEVMLEFIDHVPFALVDRGSRRPGAPP